MKYAIPVFFGLLILLESCNLSGPDSELNSYEEDFIAEQTAASVSTDEGGVLSVTASLSDPAYYEELAEDPDLSYDAGTGTFSITTSMDIPYGSGSTDVYLSYKLYDSYGNLQNEFNSETTYRAEVAMQFSHDVETERYTGQISKNTHVISTGLNTANIVTLTGDWSSERTTQTSPSMPRSHTTSFSHSLALNEVTYTYDETSGTYLLSGGSGSSLLEGSINNKSFTRAVEWIFADSRYATMIYEGESVTVEIETGIIVED